MTERERDRERQIERQRQRERRKDGSFPTVGPGVIISFCYVTNLSIFFLPPVEQSRVSRMD